MNKQELVDASREHLRLSIACTLSLDWNVYQSSIEAQSAVNRCLTNVMSLGYNEDFVEALKEAIQYQFFGGSPSSEEFDELVTELRACRNTFQREVAAYRHLHHKFDEGEPPLTILEEIKEMTPLSEEYKQQKANL